MKANDKAVRPNGFDEFLGQDDAKRNLKTMVLAAKSRGECIDHVLLAGPPGLGKTSLACVISQEMGSRLVQVMCPTVKTREALIDVLLGLDENDVLLLDEIHSLDLKVEELLYTVMEDSKLCFITKAGDAVNIPLPRFTIVAATTRSGDLSQPLRDRFARTIQMQFYTVSQLTELVTQTAAKIDVWCTRQAAVEVAKRSRGTPRVANAILRMARDEAQSVGASVVEAETVITACESNGIDSAGLDSVTRKYVEFLSGKTKPVGVATIAAYVGEPVGTLETTVEPYLIRIGLIEKLPSGRILTQKGANHAVSCKIAVC
jgi:Holliday junction DNA helicase RuvB